MSLHLSYMCVRFFCFLAPTNLQMTAAMMPPPPPLLRKKPTPTKPSSAKGGERSVSFMISKSGERVLLIDQWRYIKDTENAMLVFWRCRDANINGCPSRVATTKKEKNVRVVVINDTHVHSRRSPSNSTRSKSGTLPVKIKSEPTEKSMERSDGAASTSLRAT